MAGFQVGAKYALAVGVAAATVGIIIGVVTLTGVGFKFALSSSRRRRATLRAPADVRPGLDA